MAVTALLITSSVGAGPTGAGCASGGLLAVIHISLGLASCFGLPHAGKRCQLRLQFGSPSSETEVDLLAEGGEQYVGYLSGILSDRMSGLCRDYVGILSDRMSVLRRDYVGYFVGPYVGSGQAKVA